MVSNRKECKFFGNLSPKKGWYRTSSMRLNGCSHTRESLVKIHEDENGYYVLVEKEKAVELTEPFEGEMDLDYAKKAYPIETQRLLNLLDGPEPDTIVITSHEEHGYYSCGCNNGPRTYYRLNCIDGPVKEYLSPIQKKAYEKQQSELD